MKTTEKRLAQKREYISLETRIADFEKAYHSGDYANELTDLAKAIVSIVIHTVRDPQRKTGKDNLTPGETWKKANYNKLFDTMLASIHANPTIETEYFISECIVTILELMAKYGTLTDTIEYKHFSKKVVINDLPEIVTDEIKPIQLAHRAVRNAINHEKSVKFDPANGYLYFSDILTLEDDDGARLEETIYRRSPKYADMGAYVEDFNGKEENYTATLDSFLSVSEMIDLLRLSPMQKTILQYRMQGYGKHTIARKLDIKEDTYKTHVKRIREKAERLFMYRPSRQDYDKNAKHYYCD